MAPRIDTPLSKALLESGSIDPGALEDAVQEQLIHGGALDTILLERSAVDERTLAELLAKAWQTEPVPLDSIEHPAAAAVKALPERMALAMRLCPFAVEGTAIHVLCASPLDRGLVEEVSALLLKALVPHVVPEVRLWQGLQHAYGTAPDERFAALLNDLQGGTKARREVSEEGAPLDDEEDLPMPGASRWDVVEALAHLAAQGSREGIVSVAVSYARKFMPFAAMIGVRHFDGAATCVGWLRSGPSEGVQFEHKPFVIGEDSVLDGALKSPSPSLGKPAITPGNAALFGWLGRRRPRTFLAVPIVIGNKPVGALVADGGIRARDFGSLSDLVSFAARLGPAFESLLRARRSLPPEPAPASVSGAPASRGTASASVSAAPPSRDAASASVSGAPASMSAATATGAQRTKTMPFGAAIELPVEVSGPTPAARMPPPAFDIHTEITAPGLEPMSEDWRNQLNEVTAPVPMLQGLGPGVDIGVDVPAPPPMPVQLSDQPRPITLTSMPAVQLVPPPRDGTSPFARNYVVPPVTEPPRPPPPRRPTPVAVVVEDLNAAFAEVTDSHATEAWRGALEDAVERGHQGGTFHPEDQAHMFLGDEGWEDVRYDTYDVAGAAQPAVSMPDLIADTGTVNDGAPITEEEPPSPLEALVDQLGALDEVTVERAKKKLLERGTDIVPALEARFPGRLRGDPFDPGESVRSAEKLSPVVETLYALGPAGLDAAIPHLDSRYPAHRYAAVLLFTLTPDERGIDLLRARLHDSEPKIRQLAADALAPFVAHPRFEAVLVSLRERLQSPLLDARRRAVQLLGVFRDVGCVPLLIALLDTKSAAELAEDARRALRVITLQDFGVRPRGWEKWWSKAKKRSRVDWLIEGLSSEDREIRTVAHGELAAITGDDFGYRPDEPRRNRQRAVAVFQTWWTEEQRRPNAG